MELLTRNVANVIDRENLTRKLKSGKKLVIKLGRDPRTPSLTLGHSVPLRKLRAFQLAGHHIVIVIGDFTALLGDPNAGDNPREVLSTQDLEKNVKEIKKVFFKILDPKKTKITYNSAWLGKLRMGDIIKLASAFTVQQNIERDLFQRRLESGKPIGLHEFLYPLMQAYDSVFLKPDLEVGGTDQTFNLLAGRTLMKSQGLTPQDILTTPMLIGTDGREMHSSWGNTISLTDTPTDMYGKLMGIRDELIIKYMELTTDMTEPEIEGIRSRLSSRTMTPLTAKKALAREIVTLYHSAAAAKKAESEFERVVQQEGIPTEKIPWATDGHNKFNLLQALPMSGATTSASTAKRLIEQGGVEELIIDPRSGEIESRKKVTLLNPWIEPAPRHKQKIIKVGKRKALEIKS